MTCFPYVIKTSTFTQNVEKLKTKTRYIKLS